MVIGRFLRMSRWLVGCLISTVNRVWFSSSMLINIVKLPPDLLLKRLKLFLLCAISWVITHLLLWIIVCIVTCCCTLSNTTATVSVVATRWLKWTHGLLHFFILVTALNMHIVTCPSALGITLQSVHIKCVLTGQWHHIVILPISIIDCNILLKVFLDLIIVICVGQYSIISCAAQHHHLIVMLLLLHEEILLLRAGPCTI